MRDPQCIFCKIVLGEIPSAKIYEDDKVSAFLDINPVSKGHTLLISKEHYPTIAETPDETVSYVFLKARDLMTHLKKAMNSDFVALSVVGVDVSHFHVHLIPRRFDDGLKTFNWPTKKYGEGEIQAVAAKIVAQIKHE